MEDNRPIRPFTAYQGAKTLHIHPICMLDAVSGGPQPQPWFHNIILVHFGSIFLPHFSKKSPPPHLNRCYSVRVHPYAHPEYMNVLKHFIYLQYGCWMQYGTSCSLNHDTTTSFGSTLPHLHRCYSKVGPTGPTTAYECAQTLHIPPIWMWDAVWDLLQPQPWHHNVIWLNLTPPPQA
jgi:hypothetical protein